MLGFMNQFLQGGEMCLKKKGSQYLKTKNLPVIILSNFSPIQSYSKVQAISLLAFEARLKVIELTEPIFALTEFLNEVIEG